ncbi:MAG: SGNH/GDSL hydrolase family protein [Treponema sp.]|nr:SGNH/GDSL hydrolase family protein [Treponema sp.]
MVTSIIAWGDSILKGVVSGGDSKRFDITEKDSLSQACAALGIELANKSVFGSWMTKTRRTQDRSLRNGASAQIGIIESGTNDSDYDWSAVSADPDAEHLQRCPLDEFSRLMEEAVSVARQNKITPVIMIPTPLVPEWWLNNICIGNDEAAIVKFIARKYGLQGGDQKSSHDQKAAADGDCLQDLKRAAAMRLYQNQELFSLKAAAIARSLGVQIVDIRSEFLAHPNYKSLMCLDGVHPNQAGYDFMAQIWKREMPRLGLEF